MWVGNERVTAFLGWFSLCFHWSVGKLALVLVLIVLTPGLEILFIRLKIQIYINSYFACSFQCEWLLGLGTCGCCGHTQDDFFVTTESTRFFFWRFLFLGTVFIHLYMYSNLDFKFLLITTLHCIPVEKSVEHPVFLRFLLIVSRARSHLLTFSQWFCFLQSSLENKHSCRIVLITVMNF